MLSYIRISGYAVLCAVLCCAVLCCAVLNIVIILFAVTLALASATAWEFYKVDAFAGKILLPYLAWLAFANALNYSIWKKNPGVS